MGAQSFRLFALRASLLEQANRVDFLSMTEDEAETLISSLIEDQTKSDPFTPVRELRNYLTLYYIKNRR